MNETPAIVTNAEANLADLRRRQAEALTNDVRDTAERSFRVWNKAYNPNLATLSPGEHSIAVFQGFVIAVGQQAAALTVANPNSDPEWLRTMLMQQFAEAFDGTRDAMTAPPATPTEQ